MRTHIHLNALGLAVTYDLWGSSALEGYFGATGHYISDEGM